MLEKRIFQWKGPVRARAERVPPEKWREHKEEIESLHQTCTLEELMAQMQARYNFKPSPRQYVSQFKKWGLQKYHRSGAMVSVEQNALTGNQPATEAASPDVDPGTNDARLEVAGEKPSQSPTHQIILPGPMETLEDRKIESQPERHQKLCTLTEEDQNANLVSTFDRLSLPQLDNQKNCSGAVQDSAANFPIASSAERVESDAVDSCSIAESNYTYKTGLHSTLAPSADSSDISSFRRLRKRLKTKSSTTYELTPPSSKIRFSSGTSLHRLAGFPEHPAHVGGEVERDRRRLYEALMSGDESTVRKIIRNGADINASYGYFYGNALQAASVHGYVEIVRLLLENGADVNALGGYYGDALQVASRYGYIAIVRLLLEKGADVNAQGGHYGNALQIASRYGYVEIVQLLLEKGADVNARGGLYGNALQAASTCGDIPTVRLLLQKGADVAVSGGHYGSALQAASARGHHSIVQLLLEAQTPVNNIPRGRHFNPKYAALHSPTEWQRAAPSQCKSPPQSTPAPWITPAPPNSPVR